MHESDCIYVSTTLKRIKKLLPLSELQAEGIDSEGEEGVAPTVEAALRAGRHLPSRLQEVRHWQPREIFLQVRIFITFLWTIYKCHTLRVSS